MKINTQQIKYWAMLCENEDTDETILENRRKTAKEMNRTEPYKQGYHYNAKEIPSEKFYMNREMKTEGDIIYALYQIVMLYCGNMTVPKDVDASQLFSDQWESDMGKYAGLLLGKDIDVIKLDNGWSSNNTVMIKKAIVDYFKQDRDKRDSSQIKQFLREMDKQSEQYRKAKTTSK